VVQIRVPQDGATVSTPTVTVRFTVRTPSDEPVTAIKALIDGRPVAQPRRVRLTAWGNGAFSRAVIEGRNGKADERRTGRITVTMLDLYVAERVKELTKGQ
jgi:hypothetical protein